MSLDTCPGHEHIIRLLVQSGAKVDAEDKSKQTPLHHAAIRGISVEHLHWDLRTSLFI